jgi:hypothetical protein
VLSQFLILVHRQNRVFLRNKNALLAKLIQIVGFAFLTSLTYSNNTLPQKDTIAALRDTSGMVANCTGAMVFAGVFNSMMDLLPYLG